MYPGIEISPECICFFVKTKAFCAKYFIAFSVVFSPSRSIHIRLRGEENDFCILMQKSHDQAVT